MINVDTSLPLANPYNLATYLVEQLPELFESKHNAEQDGDSFYDYLDGLIEAKVAILYALGVAENDIPKDPYGETE
jgi:hypothetical protein